MEVAEPKTTCQKAQMSTHVSSPASAGWCDPYPILRSRNFETTSKGPDYLVVPKRLKIETHNGGKMHKRSVKLQ